MEILLIRHGEMVYEPSDGFDLDLIHAYSNGVKQGPLTERGRREAKRVATRLEGERIDALYSSEYLRARETAEATARALSRSVEVISDLGELRVGRFALERYPSQRRFFGGLRRVHGVLARTLGDTRAKGVIGYALIAYFFSCWYRGRTEGGELPADALRRAGDVLRAIGAGHASGERVAVFTHGYFIHLLVNHVIDPKGAARRIVRAPYIKNGSITTLARDDDGRWTVKEYAATRHL